MVGVAAQREGAVIDRGTAPVVWIVDDSPVEAEMARRALGQSFTTRVFSDGLELIERIVDLPLPQVLLLDWLMPGVSGIEVCRFLRAREATRDLPIVLLTSQSQTQQIVEGLAAGASDYLTKPYASAELIARVNSQLRVRSRGAEVDAARLQALQQTERKYRALVNGLPDLLIVVIEGQIAFMNPLALEVFARGESTRVLGQPFGSIIHPDDRDEGLAQLARTLAGDRVPLTERRLLRHDGSPITVELTAQAVVFDGEPAVVTVARDITEQKRTQAQLMVSDRMASIGMLAAGVAHEINNPLASILSNVEYALGELKQSPELAARLGEVEPALKEAWEAGQRVRQIVRDVKIFSRSDEAQRRALVDVQSSVDSSLRMAWNEIRHRARLTKDYGAVSQVLANDARLGQVFLNLLVNAAQAIPEGHAAENEIRIVTRMIGPQVAIEVHDTGAGMPAAVLQKLFTPFFTTKPVGVGTGIGLSICHRIISGLGGEIQVESQVGKGTLFRVLLPAAPPTTRPAVSEVSPTPSASPRRGKILVVDDEQMILKAIRLTLAREHDVTGVVSGAIALEKIAGGERFDVILCDLMMPQMNGMELHARLLTLAPDQAQRIVFMSGGPFTTGAAAFLDDASKVVLEKPFDAARLRGVVNQRLG